MPNTKRDKYELARDIVQLCGGSANMAVLDSIVAKISSAFPPPAEDARQCVDRVRLNVDQGPFSVFVLTNDKAAAEIESFAQSRVERFANAVMQILRRDEAFDTETCEGIFNKADALLSGSPAKEVTP